MVFIAFLSGFFGDDDQAAAAGPCPAMTAAPPGRRSWPKASIHTWAGLPR
jgi:hypothetical protein